MVCLMTEGACKSDFSELPSLSLLRWMQVLSPPIYKEIFEHDGSTGAPAALEVELMFLACAEQAHHFVFDPSFSAYDNLELEFVNAQEGTHRCLDGSILLSPHYVLSSVWNSFGDRRMPGSV